MTQPEPPRTTPEGHTSEEPRAGELGKAGTPGAGKVPAAHHATDAHMDAHTAISDDDHGHAEQSLGPIDWAAWGFAVAGALAGLLVVALFWLAISRPA